MKRILIIKMSSLGDVIHTLPALTDATQALNNIQFDWVVEENFSAIPGWHPAVKRVIPVAIRRWRKHLLQTLNSGEWQHFKTQLQARDYDAVIDAQGLIKSALITRLAKGSSYGLDRHSAREPLAAGFYQNPVFVAKGQHAVARIRQLFASVLKYQIPAGIDYGIRDFLHQSIMISTQQKKSPGAALNAPTGASKKNIIFFHGTTWPAKHWPETYWVDLARRLTAENYRILLPWGSENEYQRALRIQLQAAATGNITLLPKMGMNQLVKRLLEVDAVVAVDTGLAHLAAAVDKPTVTLFGPTNPGLTGPCGGHQLHLLADYPCSPCLKKHCNLKVLDKRQSQMIQPACWSTLTPQRVQQALTRLLADSSGSSPVSCSVE